MKKSLLSFTATSRDSSRTALSPRVLVSILITSALWMLADAGVHAAEAGSNPVKVLDGVVQPRRPVSGAIAEAMQFLKKADGGYVPGRIDGELAGYFTSAHVNADGTATGGKLSFPARQHAYFISTFLMYYAYTGEKEWLLRARDLGDWNLAHSTPPSAAYPNLPYSTMTDGKPGGSADKDSTEPDKAAFFGTSYLELHEATGEGKYLAAARAIAATLVKHQRNDGSWPFRVLPESGEVRQDFGGAPVFYVEFFERLLRYDPTPAHQQAHAKAVKLMLDRNVTSKSWGTYHEDVREREAGYVSAEPMAFTADYLFRQAKAHPEYIQMGRQIIAHLEETLVHTNEHAAAPAPAVSEQAGFQHLMPGHTARYCLALADLYAATKDQEVKRRALSGINALTYMQSPEGLFATFFYSLKPQPAGKKKPNWYSQHLYTVCHVLESMTALPELAPKGQDHILGSDVFGREVHYSPGRISFETTAPSRTILKLSFTPKTVSSGGRELPSTRELPSGKSPGWSFNPENSVLTVRHQAGAITVVQ